MSEKEQLNDTAELAVDRNKIIVKTSIVGIAANLFLVAFKAVVGLLSHSIAVILDAVNNLSDALSSVITIVGAKLANRQPDKKHPLGHGRIEYITSVIISVIVEEADYSVISLIIIAAAVGVKLVLSRYVKAQGRIANSQSLIASGSDAGFDAILSLSVLASALIYTIWGISLEAYVGAFISLFIIKAGIEMLMETINDILGKRADPEITNKIKKIISEEPDVRGAYDVFLNNYGPEKNYASVHIELPDTMTVDKVDALSRRIQARVYTETGVILTGVGVYSYNTSNTEIAHMRNAILEKVMSHDWALQLHGFYVDEETKLIRFDVVMSFDIDSKDGLQTIYEEVSAMYPDYKLLIAPDVDISDI